MARIVTLCGQVMMDAAVAKDEVGDYHWEGNRLVFTRSVSVVAATAIQVIEFEGNVKHLDASEFDVSQDASPTR